MNCIEFRHQLLIDPLCKDPAFYQHRDTCAACAREAMRAIDLEEKLHESLSVTPPDGLNARIILAQTMNNEKSRSGFHYQWLAATAMIMLIIGVTGWLGFHWSDQEHRFSGLQTAVLNHITDELDHLHEDRNVQTADIAGLLTPFGARLDGNLGRVNYAGSCNIRRQAGVHLVVPGQQGSVTILLMPGEHVDAEMNVSSSRFSGRIIPTDYGSIAVVGEQDEELDSISDNIIRNVHWAS